MKSFRLTISLEILWLKVVVRVFINFLAVFSYFAIYLIYGVCVLAVFERVLMDLSRESRAALRV